MRLEHINFEETKGWYAGPWNSKLEISVGFATTGIDDPHQHSLVTEIYLVAQGTAQIRVEKETVELVPGDMLVLDPNEAHTFLASSEDYFHFVIHTPGLNGALAKTEKQSVLPARLGL